MVCLETSFIIDVIRGEEQVSEIEKQLDKDGFPIIKTSKSKSLGILVVEARITDLEPNKEFAARMRLKQKASADRAIAREQRIQEEEQKLLEIAKGQRQIATTQAAALVEQIAATTAAETEKQLAITAANKLKESAAIDEERAVILLAIAKIDAEAVTVAADATSYKKRVILEADNALAQKLEAWVTAQEVWADAFARRNVPTTTFGSGGSGGAGTDSDVTAFMNIMTMKAARELSVDINIVKGSTKQ